MNRARQALVGATLAVSTLVGWLAIHVTAIFVLEPRELALAELLLLILVQTWLSTAMFITAHDAMHGSLVPGRPRINDAFGRLALMLYAGLDYDRMKPAHFLHHRYPASARDPDFTAGDPCRLLPWLRSFFLTYYTHAQLLRITAVALLYIAAGASLGNIGLFWAAPALLALAQLFVFGTYLPHRAEARGYPDHHHARSNDLPHWLSLLTCFHFGGYHHEHHRFPHLPWWRLPQARSSSKRSA